VAQQHYPKSGKFFPKAIIALGIDHKTANDRDLAHAEMIVDGICEFPARLEAARALLDADERGDP
jgi:hypothetical protein